MNKFLIGDFEGPLDLLLHLIKQSKMDISEIKIVEITEQYINFIKEMEEMNLDIASEYLVTASELIEMKSRYLLPKPPKEETDELVQDPEEELKRRLLEYQKYKSSVESFRTLENNRSNFYTKAPEKKELYTSEKVENDGSVTAYDLLEALQKLSAHVCKVIRAGKLTVIPAKEVVPGDIVVLDTGDFVPADLRLTEAINLKIQEAALTRRIFTNTKAYRRNT